MDSDETKQDIQSMEIDYLSIKSRAESAERNKKFNISSNHLYSLLTKSKELSIPTDEIDLLKKSFKYNLFFLSSSLIKDKLLNYLFNSDLFVLSTIEIILFSKFSQKDIIYDEDYKDFLSDSNTYSSIREVIKSDENIVEKSIFEHNIYSIQLLFDNVSIDFLEKKLRKTQENVLFLLFKLIVEGKVKAKIDEAKGMIFFIKSQVNYEDFDYQIKNFCSKVLVLNETS
jgi:hypothetical protein